MNRRTALTAVGAAVLTGHAATSVGAGAGRILAYTITDLGTLGGSASVGTGLNAAGDVVGGSTLPGQAQEGRAFLWRDGAMADLEGLPGGGRSDGISINGAGWIVGTASAPPGVYGGVSYQFPITHAVLWRNGSITDLVPHGRECFAYAVNDAGQVVGTATLDGWWRPFQWEHGHFINLSAVGPWAWDVASDINNHGHIVGNFSRRGSVDFSTAFQWVDGEITDLGAVAGGRACRANAISDSGWVVGTAAREPGKQYLTPNFGGSGLSWVGYGGYPSRAYLWEGDSALDLGTLGGERSEAHAVNNRGLIVGWAYNASGQARAFLWEHGVMYDLNHLVPLEPGLVLNGARAINDAGQIVANGQLHGQARAFLLTPSPIPLVTHLPRTGSPVEEDHER